VPTIVVDRTVVAWMREAEAMVTSRADYLTQLDAAIGDGDHGINMTRGFEAVGTALADTLNAAADAAVKTVGLLDSTKFKRASLLTVRSAQSLDLLITDDGLDAATAEEFRAAGVKLVIAERAALDG
jgi:DeoR family fructose operon transcriptional repressor